MPRLRELERLYREIHAVHMSLDSDLVCRRVVPAALESELLLIGQALAKDTQRRSGLPYCFPGEPPRLSRGGQVLDAFLARIGYTIDPSEHARQYAYHTDLVPLFPGRQVSGEGDLVPGQAEVERSALWLEREVALVDPRAVLALGKEPALSILRRYGGVRAQSLGQVVGRRFEIRIGSNPIPAYAVYHPSGAWQFPKQAPAAYDYVAGEIRSLLR
jgi:uracil-DNA glycosylase family 4